MNIWYIIIPVTIACWLLLYFLRRKIVSEQKKKQIDDIKEYYKQFKVNNDKKD